MEQNNDQSEKKTNRPPGDAFRQQRLAAWQPIMTPFKVIVLFIAIGIAFIPTGTTLLSDSKDIRQHTIQYDGDGRTVDCSISKQDQGKVCYLNFTLDHDLSSPVYVYYQLENFFQNHRIYVSSVNYYQMSGESETESSLKSSCVSKYKNGSLIINPCGLIANSYFTDKYTLLNDEIELDESNLAWSSDSDKFKQPSGFEYTSVDGDGLSSETVTDSTCETYNLNSGCKYYQDSTTGKEYLFYYPDDDDTQYLYETYPNHISPITGVTDGHFKVWMRTAALPKFRKLYGRIHEDLKKGTTLSFQVEANYEVNSFDAKKSLVISEIGEFGGRNDNLGVAYIIVGVVSLFFGLLFLIKQLLAPRPPADISMLNWN